MDPNKLSLKLTYLNELQQLSHSPHFAAGNIGDRILRVCDNIEIELGIATSPSVLNIAVKGEVDPLKIVDEVFRTVGETRGTRFNGI
ncbi:hypothetical protein [Brevibacillus porteri]|uniref:Uncharacterized protein n=1 Tax=Brevibacillus porteri TaxID=2126350 RepID=A0ABX5FJI4_9BACL|nr:hypothetical protein [Brevibacillus porteri]MED1801705.1 hypothetical protein [Brevibacillus porteri]MED2135275.1 hypothetical protein [Brevibacillus porteri]MED2748011.1 hypothetical protein [Brevibacillus porteri]MED2813753.1 hypothetical protein [Brevibacillus porteri]MED2894749.1 hypothetical protein [Brevibacillus porteri]